MSIRKQAMMISSIIQSMFHPDNQCKHEEGFCEFCRVYNGSIWVWANTSDIAAVKRTLRAIEELGGKVEL